MSEPEDFERGYTGHGRGIVVTQPAPGVFHERPMTAGELAAREPAWAIGADPYEFLTRAAAAAYIRCWEVIAPAIEAALAAQAGIHDRRVVELLNANNREVERRREAEAIVRDLAEFHERASKDDWADFMNGDVGDGRCGHDEVNELGERALKLRSALADG